MNLFQNCRVMCGEYACIRKFRARNAIFLFGRLFEASERGTPTADDEGGAGHPSATGVPQRAKLTSVPGINPRSLQPACTEVRESHVPESHSFCQSVYWRVEAEIHRAKSADFCSPWLLHADLRRNSRDFAAHRWVTTTTGSAPAGQTGAWRINSSKGSRGRILDRLTLATGSCAVSGLRQRVQFLPTLSNF